MKEYSVAPHDFAASNDPASARITEAVQGLIDRYGIRRKRVLAIGSGIGWEESRLAVLGDNKLTLIDLDPEGHIERSLKKRPPGPMRYIITDALEPWNEPFDVLFASGFAPDEFHRRDQFRPDCKWELHYTPFHPAVMRHAEHLPPGGWMLIQSFGYSLDARHHPTYFPSCAAQLARHGLAFVEAFCLEKSPGVMLYAAQRLRDLTSPLMKIHGRSELSDYGAERIWP